MNNNNNAPAPVANAQPPNTLNPTTIRISMSSINQAAAKSDRYNMNLRFDDEDDVEVDSSDYSDDD